MFSPPQAALTVSVTVVSELWSRLRATVVVAQAGEGPGESGATSHILQASTSMRPSPAATAQTPTSSASATTASMAHGAIPLPLGS